MENQAKTLVMNNESRIFSSKSLEKIEFLIFFFFILKIISDY